MSKSIFFSVGEPSGDQHAARLIRSLKKQTSDLSVRGFGGPAMQTAGCQIDLELTNHAVVGILEVLPKLREFFKFVDDAEAIFASGTVDAVVMVDFPGFNWHIAKRAKQYGIPVYYYCPPQLWAWGAWRVKKMKASVDHVLAVLPIEKSFFSSHGIPTTFVGHPFFDAVKEQTLDPVSVTSLESAADGHQTVAVLPGSRTHEVHRNWPIMLAAIRRLSERHPQARFAVAAYRDKHLQFCKSLLTADDVKLPLDFYQGATSEIIETADCAMMVSGSVSLELMARRTPAAVIYRVGRFLYGFGKCVVKVDSMTLPNLMQQQSAIREGTTPPIGEHRVFPEIVSVGKPDKAIEFLTRCIDEMLGQPDVLQQKLNQLDQLREQYAKAGASDRAATRLIELLADDAETSTPISSRGAA